MHELTIDEFKYFIINFDRGSTQSFAKTFAREFKTSNAELLLIDDNDEAKEYIFRKYLLH